MKFASEKSTGSKHSSHKMGGLKNTFFSGILAACLLSGSLALPVQTARAADAVMKIGVLDEVKLGEGYTKYRSEVEDMDRRRILIRSQVNARRFFTVAEGARFDELIRKGTARAAQENTDLDALTKVGNDRESNYVSLSGKAALTADEKTALKDMQDYQTANAKASADLENTAGQAWLTTMDATDNKYIDNANAMVQKIAVEQKLTVLLRKDAIVWSTPTVDITDDVLKRLNGQQ